MADDIRQRIIASVFSKRSASGALEEQYVAHIKIFEDTTPGADDAGKKARYILLALSLNGGLIHKSRENTNGTFSIGKTWDLKELRALEVSGRTPGFDIAFARRYKWQTESWEDQETFLIATVRLFRRIMGGQSPQLVGWRMPEVSTGSRSSASTSAAGDELRSIGAKTPPVPTSARRAALSPGVGGNDLPPRSASPGRLTPRQMAAGFRPPSPSDRSGTSRATSGKGSFDQTLSPVNGRGYGMQNGISDRDRRTPSPGPGPSPRSAYPSTASSGTERPYAANRSPLVPRGDRGERAELPPSRDNPPAQSSRTGRNRPPDLEKTSFDRSRDVGLPATPRATPGTGAARSDRAPSPAGYSEAGLPRNPYPASRSDRAPSPQPSERSITGRNGISPGPASARRPRGGSRSERAPSPTRSTGGIPQRTPRQEPMDLDYRRAPSRSERAPSPNPPPSEPFRGPGRPRGASRSERAPSPPVTEPIAPLRPRAGSRTGRADGYAPTRDSGRERSTERVIGGSIVTSPLEITKKKSMDSAPSPKAVNRPRKRSDVADPRDRPPLPVALNQGVKKDPYARISFFDPANQATADRLLAADKAAGEEESNEATIANIEEMLEGYEWTAVSSSSWDSKSAADQIEARLLKELTALDAANMYSFVEQDDRVETVLNFIDEALKELDEMDGSITSYKSHLNAVVDDISYIQGQNRGLQVQTQNQRALLKELEGLLQTVNVDREALLMLTNQSLEKRSGLLRLEEGATELYKALIAGKDTDMAATMERLDEYRTYNGQFCQRILDFLPMMMSYQGDLVLKGKSKEQRSSDPLVIAPHTPMEEHLLGYAGLVRYMKEMDETRYGKLCGAYFGVASQLYKDQIKILLDAYIGTVRKATDEESELNFAPPTSSSALSRGATMRRAGTIVRSPLESRNKDKDKDKGKTGDLRGYEAFGRILDQICPLTYREEEFLSTFLQINETGETFADYMNLDSYFRRNAARWIGLSRETQKLLRGAMDLIFSFLPDGLKKWIDDVLDLDKLQMVGISAHLERYRSDAEERGNTFLARLLQKQQQRLAAYHNRQTDELIKSIEATKLSAKKRKGVVHYIKYFPVFVNRVEGQLAGADSFEIRNLVDNSYEKIVNAMFDSLQQTAKLEGEGEDKGQMNYHIILIENMHSFISDMGQQSLGSVSSFTRRAEGIYEENLHAYTRLLIRRPFQKLMDFADGAEKLLKTLSPADVASNSSYNKSTLKKLSKDNNVKDLRRHVDTLFKRVEKHFSEGEETGGGASGTNVAMPGTVLFAVWKACEDDLISLTERILKIIATCHKESSLEYTIGDVETAFKKHRA